MAETKTITATIIAREKAQAVKKNGLLEIIETKESLKSIGGLDCLKDWGRISVYCNDAARSWPSRRDD